MFDYHSAIQRQIEHVRPRPYSFDAFQDRRLRKARRRRVGAAGLGLLVAALVVASVMGALQARRHAIGPATRPITPSNVSRLGLFWSRNTGASIDSSPTVSGKRVYVTNTEGALLAFPTSCAGAPGTCQPIWAANAGPGSSFQIGSPAIGNGVVFVGSQGELLGYPTSCGPGVCKPTWMARTGGDLSSASPVIADGVVYAGSGDGKLYAFAADCISFPRPCPPLWTASLQGGFGARGYAGATPAVAGGVVYVGSTAGTLYAFPTSCGGGGTCRPLSTAKLPGVLSNPLVVTAGTVYVTSGSDLYAFPTRCLGLGKACGPDWIGHTSSLIVSAPTVGEGYAYVGSVDGVVSVFPRACAHHGRDCQPAWSISNLGHYPNPSLDDGVLYVGIAGYPDRIEAFSADCGASGATCSVLWTFPVTDGGSVIQQVVSDGSGALFAASGDPAGGGAGGVLYAFRLGAHASAPSQGVSAGP